MRVTRTKLIFCTSLFFVLFDNFAFFQHVMEIYPVTLKNIGFPASNESSLIVGSVFLFSVPNSENIEIPLSYFIANYIFTEYQFPDFTKHIIYRSTNLRRVHQLLNGST